jgi:hypothetical protein
MCNVIVTEDMAFSSRPKRQQVLDSLFIGSFDPVIYDHTYVKTTANDVTMYETKGTISEDTIFEVVDDHGITQRRKNIIATADLAGTGLTFRAPVQFMSVVEPTARDALYETDAVIDHLLHHENTAPFVALKFAQRFGTSNPSTHYIQTIAEAFRTGEYVYSDGSSPHITYGQGQYGDLAATIAATLLDREARSVLLEDDPSHGGLKEVRPNCVCILLSWSND